LCGHEIDAEHRLALAFVLIAEMFRFLPGLGLIVPPAPGAVHNEERPEFAYRDHGVSEQSSLFRNRTPFFNVVKEV
jgi:hypothetical protein